MQRRTFLLALSGGVALPALALAQEAEQPQAPTAASGVTLGEPPPVIDPQNALEFAFVQALTNENMRPIFRRYLLDTHVALALAGPGTDAAPLEIAVRPNFRAGAIFTSAARLQATLGANAPHVMINGRGAFERLSGKNVVINYRLVPMLTLEPSDVAAYLETPGESSAGPTQ